MTSYPALKRSLSAVVTIGVFGVIVALLIARSNSEGEKAVAAQNADAGIKATATDWPIYGGSPARNMVSLNAKDIPAEWITDEGETENIKWTADLGSKAYGGPIIANGRIFVGTNNQKPRNPKDIGPDGQPIDLGVLMCFEQATGKFLWQTTYKKLAAGQVQDWPREGICSSPIVDGDKVYYVSNRCELVAAKVEDGSIVWKLDMIGKLGVFPHNLATCSPLIVGDKLFVVTANGVNEDHISVPAPKAPSFLCVDKSDGKIIWQNNDPTKNLLEAGAVADTEEFFKALVNRAKLIQHGQWSNPSYGVINGQPQVIFPGGDGWIYAFEPDSGKTIWKFDCNPKDSAYQLGGRGTRNDFIATPVIYKDRVYIGVGQDPEHDTGVGHLWCIDMTKKGDVSPEIVTDSAAFPPKTEKNPNSAMVWHYGGKGDPKKIRRNYYFGRTMSTCAIKDDLVYISELAGMIHCLDANTGESYWNHDTLSTTWSSPYLADNKVFLGVDGEVVFVFEHSKKKRVLAENEMGGRVRATPVAVGNTLYVMTENKLFAIEEKK